MTAAPDPLARLAAALDQFSRALESGDAGTVLAAGEPLAAEVSALALVNLRHLSVHPSIVARIDSVRRAVERCRALGRAIDDVAAIVAPPDTGYGRRGRVATTVARTRTIAART